MNELNKYQQAAGHIGRTYGIKKIVGIIETSDDELNFHTKCILCQQITDIKWTTFLNNQSIRFNCTVCGATITYNKQNQPVEDPKSKSISKPKKQPKVHTAPKQEEAKVTEKPPVEVLSAEPETSKTEKFNLSDYPALSEITDPLQFSGYRYNKYAVLVGETINRKIITGIKQAGNRMMYTLKCEECETESKLDCSVVVNNPEKVPLCRCGWVRKGVKKPKPGDIIQGFTVVTTRKGTTSHTEWYIDCKCPECGNIKGFTIREIITPGAMICGHKGSGYTSKKTNEEESGTDDGESSPKNKLKNVAMNQAMSLVNSVNQTPSVPLEKQDERNAADSPLGDQSIILGNSNRKFPLPVIKHYNSPEVFDEIDTTHPVNRHLYTVYRSMIYRAKTMRLPIVLEWYDPDVPTINNTNGYQKFFIWSHRSGYVESPSTSMRNISQLRRRDEAYGFSPENCYWKMLNS